MIYYADKSIEVLQQDGQGIVQMPDGTLHIMNETALMIFKMMEGNTVQSVAQKMAETYPDVKASEIQDDVANIVKMLLEKKLLIEREEFPYENSEG